MTDQPTNNPIFTRQEALAPSGVHDTHLYDPNAADNQVVAVFETYARASAARDALMDGGNPASNIDVLHTEAEGQEGYTDRGDGAGLWGTVMNFFGGEEPQHGYAEGLSRGHALLQVKPPAGARHEVVRLLATMEPLDFDARLEEWRSAGWDGVYVQRV